MNDRCAPVIVKSSAPAAHPDPVSDVVHARAGDGEVPVGEGEARRVVERGPRRRLRVGADDGTAEPAPTGAAAEGHGIGGGLEPERSERVDRRVGRDVTRVNARSGTRGAWRPTRRSLRQRTACSSELVAAGVARSAADVLLAPATPGSATPVAASATTSRRRRRRRTGTAAASIVGRAPVSSASRRRHSRGRAARPRTRDGCGGDECAIARDWRWRWKSNPRTGFCRPLPEPLGYATGTDEVIGPGSRLPSRVRAVGGNGSRRRAAVVCLAVGSVSDSDAAGAAPSRTPPSVQSRPSRCDWPMWGYSIGRTFATRCSLASHAVGRHLRLRWFTSTHDVVTATPALFHGTLYVGDWSGRVTAISARTGRRRWTFRAPVHPQVYSGQIVASAAVATSAASAPSSCPRGTRCSRCVQRTAPSRWSYRIGQRVRGQLQRDRVVTGRRRRPGDLRLGRAQRAVAAGPPGCSRSMPATGRVRWRT